MINTLDVRCLYQNDDYERIEGRGILLASPLGPCIGAALTRFGIRVGYVGHFGSYMSSSEKMERMLDAALQEFRDQDNIRIMIGGSHSIEGLPHGIERYILTERALYMDTIKEWGFSPDQVLERWGSNGYWSVVGYNASTEELFRYQVHRDTPLPGVEDIFPNI